MTNQPSKLLTIGHRDGLTAIAPATAVAAITSSIWADALPIPDVRLLDRSPEGDRRRAPAPALKRLPVRRTVMVVDDDPMMLEVLVRILTRENYDLIVANSGPEALRQAVAREGAIDLLVTDYVMPEMRGRELADKMRAHIPDIAVLYQTGFSDMLFEDRRELEERAAFLEKPFSARGLLEAARFMLFGTMNPPRASAA